MLAMTIGYALSHKKMDIGQVHCVYTIHTSDTVLYVGCSVAPFKRLAEHLNKDLAHQIGGYLRENRPACLEWVICLYTVRECEHWVHSHLEEHYKEFLRQLAYQESPPIEYPRFYTEPHAMAEQALINYYQPPYNILHRKLFSGYAPIERK